MDPTLEVNRNQIISDIQFKINQYQITKQELFGIDVEDIKIETEKHKGIKQSTISKLLYYIGGALFMLGVVFWISINWEFYTDFGKVLILLGSPIVFFISGYLIEKSYTYLKEFTIVLYLLSSVIMPGGFAYTYMYLTNYAEPKYPEYVVLGIFGLYSITLALYALITKFGNLFLFFQLLSLSIIYYTVAYIVKPFNYDTGNYATIVGIVLGFIWAMLSMYFGTSRYFYKVLAGTVSMVLIGIFIPILGGINDVLELSLFVNIFIAITYIYYSIKSKSSILLAVSTVYFITSLLGFIIDVFGEFTSWPILVIVSGLIVMACGYYSFYLQRTYIKNTASIK